MNSYAQSALSGELNKLRTAAGGRNNQLFESAAALYELVNGGELTLPLVESSLTDTAVSIGLGEREVIATLASAKRKVGDQARRGKGNGRKPLDAAPGGQLARRPVATHTPPDSDWQTAASAAVDNAHQYLLSDKPGAAAALAWLTDRRGLTMETIRAAKLGYNPTWAEVAGGKLAPGVTIPCYAAGLQYVKVRVGKAERRRGFDKYLALAGSKTKALFGADGLPAANVVICEGEFDALLMGQFLPDGWAAVTMGSPSSVADVATWKKYFILTTSGYIAMDNDKAGGEYSTKWLEILPWLDVLPLPDGCGDLTDYWQSGGDLRGLITPAAPPAPPEPARQPVQPGPLPKAATRQPEPARPVQPEPFILPTSGIRRTVLANHILIKEKRGLTLSAELLAVKQALAGVGAI